MVVANAKRKLHYLYPDSTELVEELDMNSNDVLIRKWKRPQDKGLPSQQKPEWEYEIGEDPIGFNPEIDMMAVSDANPHFMRKDTKNRFEWRIRNMPYPKETYIIEVDNQKQQIVLKTTNKKYYKRIDIPDLKRL
jgi:protein DPCD